MPIPPLLFSQNHLIETMRKPFSHKNKLICQFRFDYSCAESQNENTP